MCIRDRAYDIAGQNVASEESFRQALYAALDKMCIRDRAKKAALIDDLMKVYDTRVKYFGNDRKYGKDWIIARKAADYIRLKGDNADPKVYYAWLGEVINEFGENSEAMGVSLYMMGSHRQLLADPNFKETYLEDYLKCSRCV